MTLNTVKKKKYISQEEKQQKVTNKHERKTYDKN
jgi:hypothetical protein